MFSPLTSRPRSPDAGSSQPKRRKIDAAPTAREPSKGDLGKVPSLFDVAKRKLLEMPPQEYPFKRGELGVSKKFFEKHPKTQFKEFGKEWEWARKQQGLDSIPPGKIEGCASQAAGKGFGFSVNYLLGKGVYPDTPLISAAKGGHLAIVERIHPDLGREGEVEAFNKAVGFGKGQVVDHFLKTWEENPPSGKVFQEAFVTAMEKGHEDIMMKLAYLSGSFSSDMCVMAASVAAGKGNLAILKIIYKERERTVGLNGMGLVHLACIESAIAEEKLNIVEFVAGSAHPIQLKKFCMLAAYGGFLPGVKFIFELITAEEWRQDTLREACREAARNGHLHVIVYLQTVGLSEADRGAACIVAAANGKTATVKKLLELGISALDSWKSLWEAQSFRYLHTAEEIQNFGEQEQNRSRVATP